MSVLDRPVPCVVADMPMDLVRAEQYRLRADPLFFKWQRGTATKEDWLAEIQKIKEEYP